MGIASPNPRYGKHATSYIRELENERDRLRATLEQIGCPLHRRGTVTLPVTPAEPVDLQPIIDAVSPPVSHRERLARWLYNRDRESWRPRGHDLPDQWDESESVRREYLAQIDAALAPSTQAEEKS